MLNINTLDMPTKKHRHVENSTLDMQKQKHRRAEDHFPRCWGALPFIAQSVREEGISSVN